MSNTTIASIRGRLLQVDGAELPIGASFKNEVAKRWSVSRD